MCLSHSVAEKNYGADLETENHFFFVYLLKTEIFFLAFKFSDAKRKTIRITEKRKDISTSWNKLAATESLKMFISPYLGRTETEKLSK